MFCLFNIKTYYFVGNNSILRKRLRRNVATTASRCCLIIKNYHKRACSHDQYMVVMWSTCVLRGGGDVWLYVLLEMPSCVATFKVADDISCLLRGILRLFFVAGL